MSETSVESAIPVQRTSEVAAAPAAPVAAPLPSLASGIPTAVLGFAVVITMLSFVNAEILTDNSLIVPAFLIMGTLAIGIGGLYEIRNGDIFGGSFGILYAAFLATTGITLRFFPPAADATPAALDDYAIGLGTWFLVWAGISAIFTMAARLVNTVAVIAFARLTLVLLLAGLANLVGGDTGSTLTNAAGWAGLLDGLAAFWLAGGLLLNTMYNREMVPLGKPMASASA
jgi:hypothetical protein